MERHLDPDIPLRSYNAFHNQTYIWHLTNDERMKLARALEARDAEAAHKLLQRSRANSVEVTKEISQAFHGMIKSAHVPANTLGAPEVDAED